MAGSLVVSRIIRLMYINIKRNILHDHLPDAAADAARIPELPQTLAADMDTLRSLNRLRRWVVAWFMFSMGAAIASPLVQPHTMELVCSGVSGSALVLHTQTGNAVLDTLDKDCALCLLGSAPPLPTPCIQPPPLAAAHNTPLPPAQVHAMAPMAAPPPARGPPSHPVCQT